MEWLGPIPEHWNTSRLKNLFCLAKRLPEEGDEIVTAFRDGEVTLRSNRRVDGFTNAIQEHGYQRVLKGDLVIHAMDAFAGAIGVSDSNGKSTPVYSVCTPKRSTINPLYYGRLMRHMALSGYINSLSRGIRERSTEFRWNEASNVILVVPPAAEQMRITEFLERETAKIDALVAEQLQLIELLKEKRQAIISHAVVKGLNRNARMKSSGIEWIGDVPAHWKVTVIKRFSILQRGYDLTDAERTEGPYPVVTSGGISGTHGSFMTRGPGVVTGRYGSTGRLFYIEGDFWPHNTSLYVSNFNGNSPRFVWYSLQTVDFAAHSAKAAVPGIDRNDIHVLPVAVPPVSEQSTIVAYLESETARLDTLTAEAQRAIDLLQERRTALISAAVTGQIDVRQHNSTTLKAHAHPALKPSERPTVS